MTIIDRFSTHLREVLVRSIRLATELQSQQVEVAHLLLALSMQKGCLAHELLTRFGIDSLLIQKFLPAAPNTSQNRATAPMQIVLAPFSEAAKICLERAMLCAQDNGHNHVGTEHLLAGISAAKDGWLNEFFSQNKISADEIKKQAEIVLAGSSQFPHADDLPDVIERLQDNLNDEFIGSAGPLDFEMHRNRQKQSALDYFAINLSSAEMLAKIDPVIGREKETERMIQILSRRTKNNPVLLGEPGTGKTAIVEGLAKKIAGGKVPEPLLDKKIYALDMGLLIAGTTFRGEFEARLKQVAEELSRDRNIILFIDELHNIVGAGSNQGTMDAANILKPVLARGEARCIGATTPAEFKKYIESDAALERRFQPIYLKESSVDDTIRILKGIKKNYEKYHHLKISDRAIEAAVRLADRYISNKFMPDKAIDILDEAAAAKKLGGKPSAAALRLNRMQRELQSIIADKEKSARSENFAAAVKLKEEQGRLEAEIAEVVKNKTDDIKPVGVLTEQDVRSQLAKILDADAGDGIWDNERTPIQLENELKKHIVGQDDIINEVAQTVRRAQLGLAAPDRPLASFLFVGASGTGKTELAKMLARTLYGQGDALIQLNMSEYNEGFGVSKLLGSPAGYVGFRESTQLTDKVKMRPHCVILFDEIDKAHKDVVRLLLQMLENGEITDAVGKKISLKHAIMIMTTTIGAEESRKANIGFGAGEFALTERRRKLSDKLKDYFSPELINRIDKICLFSNLGVGELAGVAALEINDLNLRLEKFKTSLAGDPQTMADIIKGLPQQNINARDVRREIRNKIEELMAQVIIGKKIKKTYRLAVADKKIHIK